MIASTLAATSSSGGSAISILFLVAMVGALYLLLIRPQQRRQKNQRAVQQTIDVGDEVVTIGGIYGRVTEVEDETVVVEIADGVETRFVRSAISRKLVFDDDAPVGPADEHEADGAK